MATGGDCGVDVLHGSAARRGGQAISTETGSDVAFDTPVRDVSGRSGTVPRPLTADSLRSAWKEVGLDARRDALTVGLCEATDPLQEKLVMQRERLQACDAG